VNKTKENSYVVFEDLKKATGPKVHTTDCWFYQRWLKTQTTTTTWHGPYELRNEAWELCQSLSLKTRYQPSEHVCVRA
jgi:hypothetical protein